MDRIRKLNLLLSITLVIVYIIMLRETYLSKQKLLTRTMYTFSLYTGKLLMT
jgi:hypothetical protein